MTRDERKMLAECAEHLEAASERLATLLEEDRVEAICFELAEEHVNKAIGIVNKVEIHANRGTLDAIDLKARTVRSRSGKME